MIFGVQLVSFRKLFVFNTFSKSFILNKLTNVPKICAICHMYQ
jgi:hypothetical protein